jgi:hypothetical protein
VTAAAAAAAAVLDAAAPAAAVPSAAAAAAADAADGDALSSELSACQTESDKAGLRLFNAHLKAGRQGRALEVVGGLHNTRSIEGEGQRQQQTTTAWYTAEGFGTHDKWLAAFAAAC